MVVTLIVDPVDKTLIERLKAEGIKVVEDLDLDRAGLLEKVKEVEALVVRGRTQVDAEVIRAGTKLKIIARYGVGLDNIDTETAKEVGVLVVNAAAAPAQSVAELTITLMLAVLRKILVGDAGLRRGEWLKKQMIGKTLNGKTLGIVGTGAIGQIVAKIAMAFGAKVIGYDVIQYDEVREMGVKYVSFGELLAQADIITIHVPLLPSTVKMFNAETFKKMKKEAILINTSRGGVVDQSALYRALKSGGIGGAGLDVFETEPPGEDPLFKLNNIVVTPHIAGQTQEAQEAIGEIIAQQILNKLKDM
ncbi:MAG: hydroxyacid dehydrogenase [Candidatus Heimdallarchaeota archaeon]